MGGTLNSNNDQDSNNLHLVLGLSLTNTTNPKEITNTNYFSSSNGKENSNHILNPYHSSNNNEPSLTLGFSGDNYKEISRQTYSPNSVVVSSVFSTGTTILQMKRERDEEDDDIEEEERISSRVISEEDIEDATNNARKKLRLTKEQSLLLEESFKLHSTLNPKEKQALAKQLNLRPRQVEVWFQNRRARTKLKQTEVDCELLKKCCEKLREENKRLKKEMQELKALKLTAQPLYMSMPAATLSMCPSCDGGSGGGGGTNNNKITAFTMPPNTHFYVNPFNNPSAAC